MENNNAGAGGNVSAPPVFKEIEDDPLIELSATDSTEFWLIQWPLHQTADFDGQELSLKLHHDGSLGNLETSSGKSYEVVSYNALAPDATVFLPSGSDSKVGKISRRVSLVHYPEPSELIEHNLQKKKQQRERHEKSIATNSSATPQTERRSSKSTATGSASMRSGKHRSSMPNPSKSSSKKRHSEKEATRPVAQDSGRPQSVVTSSGSMDRHSSERKSNKNTNNKSNGVVCL